MKKAIIGAAALLLLSVQAMAQGHYDPYFALPGAKGTKAADVGLATPDIGSVADVSTIFAMGKYGLSDKIEIGVRADLGVLNDIGDMLEDALEHPLSSRFHQFWKGQRVRDAQTAPARKAGKHSA